MSTFADKFAQWSVRLLVGAVIFGVVAGIVVAVIWRRNVDWTVYNIPIVLIAFAYLGAVLLAVPAFLWGVYNLIRGQWEVGARRILVLAGAVTVVLGAELFSHYVVPCDWVIGRGWRTPDWSVPWGGQPPTQGICRQVFTEFGSMNGVYSRTHLLHHTLTGGVPTLLLFLWILRKTEAKGKLIAVALPVEG